MRRIFFISLLYLISILGFSQSKLPEINLIDTDGKVVKSTSISNNGKPYAICFWAVWNKTSLLELNILMENYYDWHDEYGIEIFAISVDEKSRFPRAKAYVEAHEWKYKVLFDEGGELENAMKINGVPHLILFDKDGNIVWQEHSYDSGYEQHFLDQVHKL